MNEVIRLILILYGALSVLAFLLYLPRIWGYRYAFKQPVPRKRATKKRKISVIVPARRESHIIGDLFASLEKQNYDKAFFDINVIVADEDDPTIELARKIGAKTFVITTQKCKGDALDGYFKAIKEDLSTYDAFVIVDADAVLAPDYISELNNALEQDYDIYITRKFAKNYLGERENRSIFSNCSTLTWPIVDGLGNLNRMQKDMPLNLCGQGLMVRRKVIEEIGGWPYRTLTEDYELKLDSLIHGYKSMFYPYAVIYTEEALSHDENYIRRVRWLTGYSQCDRKYKQQIKSQARQRGKLTRGEREYFFGVYPILLFALTTALTMIAGIALAIYYGVHRMPDYFLASWLLIFMPFMIMYFLLFTFGLLAMCSDLEAFRTLEPGERAAMLLFNPFYLLEYIPIFLKSRRYARKGTAPAWKETERITYKTK